MTKVLGGRDTNPFKERGPRDVKAETREPNPALAAEQARLLVVREAPRAALLLVRWLGRLFAGATDRFRRR